MTYNPINMINAGTVVHISDLHINSTVALCPLAVDLDDGGTYHPSRGQRWLWECWQDFVNRVTAIEGEKLLIIGGDMAELDTKRRSVQLISANKATIMRMVGDVLDPLTSQVGGVVVIRGTPAHVGKSSWIEEAIANDLDHTVRQSKQTASWWQFRAVIGGQRFDVAHHAGMSGRDVASHKSPVDLAERALWYYRVMVQQPAPHWVIRSHNHRYREAEMHGLRAVFTPCWTMATENVYRSGSEYSLADIGGVVWQGGKMKATIYPAEMKKFWTLKI